MTDLPTAVFLFTDVVGSTGMWDRDADAMDRAMTAHDQILYNSITARGGTVFKHTGDGICATFGEAVGSLQAAIQGQRLLEAVKWPVPTGPRVRMALHAGEFREHSGDYFGLDVCLVRRILDLTPGGSVLITEPAVALLDEATLNHLWLLDLGDCHLRDISAPIRVHRLVAFPIGPDLEPVEFVNLD
jgi:class 3 adenylate cyclase